MTNITKLDPKNFGLEQNKVATIEQAFAPKIAERDGYIQIYDQIIKSEITPELEKQAKELRLKLVKVRTGISDIHKTQKSFFLAAGRFVDAWKNKETEPVTQMEENLMSIEKHSENIEKERIAKLETERREKVLQYSEVIPESLGLMLDGVFDAYLSGLKIAFDAKIEAERQAEITRIETERKDKLNTERKFKTSRLIDYIENYDSINFGEMPDTDFDSLCKKAIEARTKKEAEIEAQRIENERLKKDLEDQLKKEAEEKEAARLAIEKAEKERIDSENKAAAAPDKKKMQTAVINLDLSFPTLSNSESEIIEKQIIEKFTSFKKWAIEQINTL